jgi:RNA polymerase sigma-70 factor (ECF subfamily)
MTPDGQPPPGDDDRHRRFDTLYREAYHPILGYALRRCARREDALDVVSEVFTIAWRRIDDVPPGDRALMWLYGTARRVLAATVRLRERDRRLVHRIAPSDAHSSGPSSPDPAVAVSERGAVARALRSLRHQDRDLLGLVAWEGLDTRRLAEVLDVSQVAARVRLHRARARLATALTAHGVAPHAGAGRSRATTVTHEMAPVIGRGEEHAS